MIFLDHNATTPIDERVLAAMMPYLTTHYGNASSLYRHGRVARSAIESAREQLAALVKASPGQIIFTSGGTEANNLALSVVGHNSKLAISAVEHPSVFEPAEALADQGCLLKRLAVNKDGVVDAGCLPEILEFRPLLTSIMLANNETGVIQDIAGIAGQLKTAGSLVHTDAVQALGKIPVDFDALNVDLMSLSSHKIYGPKGCGALIAGKGANLKPMLRGGGQEHELRAGTENVAAIVGFGKAAELAGIELAQRAGHLQNLKKLLEEALNKLSGVTIFSASAGRLPNTVQFGVAGMDGEMLLMKLDQKGIAVSSGSACASGGGKPSPVLAAMGVNQELAKSALRVSFGKINSEKDVIEFVKVLNSLIEQK